MDSLTFQNHPNVILATNVFIGVPIILQYEDTPLIQIVRQESAGFTIEIPIYHSDGTYLAKVVGPRLFMTADGEKAGLMLSHADRVTACKQGERVLFEIRRTEAAALKTHAELHTPDGYFVKCTDAPKPELFDASGDALRIGGFAISGNLFSGCRIGILVRRDSITYGCG